MGAFRGTIRGGAETTGRQLVASSLWESGTGQVELVASGMSVTVAWLVMIERAEVQVAGHTTPIRWELRVTELLRRKGDAWERFHRHADPLVDALPLGELLALLG